MGARVEHTDKFCSLVSLGEHGLQEAKLARPHHRQKPVHDVTLLVSQADKSWVNRSARSNIWSMLATFAVEVKLIVELKAQAVENILSMLVTLAVSMLIGWLNSWAPENM